MGQRLRCKVFATATPEELEQQTNLFLEQDVQIQSCIGLEGGEMAYNMAIFYKVRS